MALELQLLFILPLDGVFEGDDLTVGEAESLPEGFRLIRGVVRREDVTGFGRGKVRVRR